CYQKILEDEHMACMGLEVAFDYIGLKYLVDVNRRKLSVETRQPIFPQLINVGISKQYPQLVDPFNFIASGIDNAGLFSYYWESRKHEENIRKGQEYARRNFKTKPYYAGKTDRDTSNKQVSGLSLQLLICGLVSGAIIFAEELIQFYFHRTYNKLNTSDVIIIIQQLH
ncbi:unnamed protein product, partial [Allacma fusca]